MGRGGHHDDRMTALVPAATTAQPGPGPGTELQLHTLLRLAEDEVLNLISKVTVPESARAESGLHPTPPSPSCLIPEPTLGVLLTSRPWKAGS